MVQTLQNFINGEFVTPAGTGLLPIVNPTNGDVVAQAPISVQADVDAAMTAAKNAFKTWKHTTPGQRQLMLLKLADAVEANSDELVEAQHRNTGQVRSLIASEEVAAGADQLRFFAGAARIMEGKSAGEYFEGHTSYVRREPIGVVAQVAPWNYPFLMAIWKIGPALAAGNTVVLKPSDTTPESTLVLARLAGEIFPAGVLNVVLGTGETGAMMVDHKVPGLVSITGSVRAGIAVASGAAKGLKRAHLELGGNSALIVLEDADIEAVISTAAWGSFFHQGQICMTTGRHLVHASLYEEYVERLAAKADSLAVGDPNREQVHLGPIIDDNQLAKVRGLVEASTAQGAKLAAGGTHDKLFYRPTVLAGLDDSTPAYAEEVFGPVAPVRSFSTVDEAAALAAAGPYGLSLGIVTGDAARGLDLAERIPTGIVHINDQTVNDEAVAPFGGIAASGTGARFGGEANVEAFTDVRWTTVRADVATYPF